MFFNTGGYLTPGPDGTPRADSREGHAAEIGAGSGITNARGLAGMYAPLANGGRLKGVTLVNRETLSHMAAVSSASALDAVLLAPTRFSLGYMKPFDNRRVPHCTENDSLILSEEAFGHWGIGGSIGFADPQVRISFGYTMNKMDQGIGLNERGQSLVDAVYLSLDYTSKASGVWLKGE